ncbi:hypothetical protein C2845_PM09G21790 [Panicum miliaceum]|uniref:Uncharacterized protein n=1 Tax=Panicum miliaceum TaxID=4540 RepID=A0A3L6S2J4_PANMI|nr:hypothetical protein C2845_PM09G21790 [Panicum miliaceum]
MVQEPAFAILCERKAARPGAMREEPVTFADATYYRQPIIPPLPSRWVTDKPHCSIGTGVAILRHNMSSDDYVLAELYPHQDSQSRLASNKATLFLCGGRLALGH